VTPDFRILADSVDVTAAIRARLLSLSMTDEAGWQSDRFEFSIDDRGGTVAMPATGARLEVSLGYRETGLAPLGAFVVDEVVISAPPMTMTVRAKAADMRRTLKEARTRAWHETTFGAIVAAIAGENGYAARVSPDLADIPIPHLDQTAESDINLLTRLAEQYGATVKAANGALLVVPRGLGKTASGRILPAIALTPAELMRWSVTLAERGKYAAVQAQYRDLASGRDVPVTVGEAPTGQPVYVLRTPYPDTAQAQAAARAKLEALERGKSSVDLTLIGRTDVMAETWITLQGFRPGADGTWWLTRVEHRLDRSGFSTECTGESVA
jgi:hypothetical protein